MRIMLVWNYWDYPEVYFESIRSLTERGHDVSVLVGEEDLRLQEGPGEKGVILRKIPQVNFLSKFTKTPYPFFKGITEWIKQVDPEIVHVHNHLFLGSYQATMASCSLGLPVVVSVHGFVARRDFLLNTSQEIYIRTVARKIFEKATAIMCLTRSDAASVAKIMGSYKKITIVPNGIDTDAFRPSFNKDPDLITWVGRFVPEKGLSYLLRAMKDVERENPGAKLVLAGDGIQRAEMASLASQLGVQDNVAFLGWVDRVGLAKILSNTSIFVFPSLREGLPRSLLEAMACGVAVVASDIAGNREVITPELDGLLVPTKDSSSLAASILRLLRDEELRTRLAENARKTVVERFDRNQSVRLEEALYADTISRFSLH